MANRRQYRRFQRHGPQLQEAPEKAPWKMRHRRAYREVFPALIHAQDRHFRRGRRILIDDAGGALLCAFYVLPSYQCQFRNEPSYQSSLRSYP